VGQFEKKKKFTGMDGDCQDEEKLILYALILSAAVCSFLNLSL
jgi:hypothetical protein